MAAAEQPMPAASDIERLGPWGATLAESGPSEAEPAAPPPQPDAGRQIGWGLVSTALLAAWLAYQWGWIVGAAALIGVFVHELGHLAAINALGCGPGRIHIIPFFGGAASMRRAPDTEFKSVLIALAGPVTGLAAAIPFYALYAQRGEPVWLKGALLIGGINLLNLAPAPPLDGSKALGPALAWIHPWVERGAMILLGGLGVMLAVRAGQPFIAVFVALGVLQAIRGQTGRRPAARRLSIGEWLGAIGLWLVALALCTAVMAPAVLRLAPAVVRT